MALNPPAVALPPAIHRDEQWFVQIKDIVDRLNLGILQGTGSPAGVVVANIGTIYRRTDGAPSIFIKESGNGTAAGWVAK